MYKTHNKLPIFGGKLKILFIFVNVNAIFFEIFLSFLYCDRKTRTNKNLFTNEKNQNANFYSGHAIYGNAFCPRKLGGVVQWERPEKLQTVEWRCQI